MKLVPTEIELITGNKIIGIKDEDSGKVFRVTDLSKYYVGYRDKESEEWYKLNESEKLYEALQKNLYP